MKYSCIQGPKMEQFFSLKNGNIFCFPARILKILRILEESYTLLYFTKKNPVQKQEKAT
jgi:hypothetical protein